MPSDELIQRLGNHEDNFTERKSEGVTSAELRQTLSAFANTVPEGRTAVLFVGVRDKDGAVVGAANTDQLQKRIREVCEVDCYPPIQYTAEVLDVEGRSVVAVVIPCSAGRPHFTGPAYVRVGSESKKASAEQFEELVLNRIDKCRAILRNKNAVFSVFGIDYVLGSGRPLHGRHREFRECRIDACNAHSVTLYDIAAMIRFTEPLKHVEVVWDDKRYRPALWVTFPRA